MNETPTRSTVATPSGTLVRKALLWAAALLVAGCSDVSRPRINPTPVQPSITSAAWPHEPTGATLITDQPFDSRTSLGWAFDQTSLGSPTIVADASAPYTPQNVVEFAYPIGFPGGGWAPGAEWTTLSSVSRVYAGLWWKSSNPWQGAGPVLAYLQTATGHLSLVTYGPAGGPYQVYVHGPTDLLPNQTPAVTLSPGTWYQVEWLVDNADPANAHIEWWVGGQLVGNYTNVQLPSDPFTSFRIEPSWGDASSKTENDYVHYDHAYISGNWVGSGHSPILDENFAATDRATYESHGWYDGTACIPDPATQATFDGYKFERDATLGRNVMYVHWVTQTPAPLPSCDVGDASAPAPAWRLNLDPATTANGATAYALFKTRNLTTNTFGGHWTRFGRGWQGTPGGNTFGQMDLDLAGNVQADQNYDPATGAAVPWGTITKTFKFYIGCDISWGNPATQNILQDEMWYEVVYYTKPPTTDAATSTCPPPPPAPPPPGDGVLRVAYRVWSAAGTNPWTPVMAGTAVNTALLDLNAISRNITEFLIGPYQNRNTDDMRHYYGTIRLYTGDAICDGTIDKSLAANPSMRC